MNLPCVQLTCIGFVKHLEDGVWKMERVEINRYAASELNSLLFFVESLLHYLL